MNELIIEFFNRVRVESNGCWTWIGGLNQNYYGRFSSAPGTRVYAHRWAYELFKGPIGPGMVLDHACHNAVITTCTIAADCPHRRCVNPWHLNQVTRRENCQRTSVAARTHCAQGHEFTAESTYIRKNGYRMCRVCSLTRSRERSAREAEAKRGGDITQGCPGHSGAGITKNQLAGLLPA